MLFKLWKLEFSIKKSSQLVKKSCYLCVKVIFSVRVWNTKVTQCSWWFMIFNNQLWRNTTLSFVDHVIVNENFFFFFKEPQEKLNKTGRASRPCCRLGFLEADADVGVEILIRVQFLWKKERKTRFVKQSNSNRDLVKFQLTWWVLKGILPLKCSTSD